LLEEGQIKMFIFLTLTAATIALMCIASVLSSISELRRESRAFRAEFARAKSI
jgi:hypothetical protein